jgi:DNA repair exonuclease SbcCD ATPase subunit
MIWLALILSTLPFAAQDDVPTHRVVGFVIPMPVAQDDTYGGPITDAIVRRLDAMQKAWADRDGVITKLIEELETRQEARDQERFGFIKEWLENLRPGPVGPVDVGPVREFFGEWKAERERQQAERAEAAAERAAWREDRERWRRDFEVAAGDRKTLLERIRQESEFATAERKTLLERLTESRATMLLMRSELNETRAEVAWARAELAAARTQFVWAVVVFVLVVFVIAVLVYVARVIMSVYFE